MWLVSCIPTYQLCSLSSWSRNYIPELYIHTPLLMMVFTYIKFVSMIMTSWHYDIMYGSILFKFVTNIDSYFVTNLYLLRIQLLTSFMTFWESQHCNYHVWFILLTTIIINILCQNICLMENNLTYKNIFNICYLVMV